MLGKDAIIPDQIPKSNTHMIPNGVRLNEPWTQKEHELFEKGIIKYGNGHWIEIVEEFLYNKTPQQVQSYAANFFKHQPSSTYPLPPTYPSPPINSLGFGSKNPTHYAANFFKHQPQPPLAYPPPPTYPPQPPYPPPPTNSPGFGIRNPTHYAAKFFKNQLPPTYPPQPPPLTNSPGFRSRKPTYYASNFFKHQPPLAYLPPPTYPPQPPYPPPPTSSPSFGSRNPTHYALYPPQPTNPLLPTYPPPPTYPPGFGSMSPTLYAPYPMSRNLNSTVGPSASNSMSMIVNQSQLLSTPVPMSVHSHLVLEASSNTHTIAYGFQTNTSGAIDDIADDNQEIDLELHLG